MNKVPSLVDLCVMTAIDYRRYLGDVGETDLHLLDRILSHCTLDQLMHIENSSEGRDLSPVTNKLWKKFYERQFGAENTNSVVERMKQRKVTFKWKQLYEAKLKALEEAQQKSSDRLRLLYEKDNARKQSRQIRLCTKIPPSSNKRSFYGGGPGSSLYNTKSSLMKKARSEFVNSREVKNLAAMKKNATPIKRPTCFTGRDAASTSKLTKILAAKRENAMQIRKPCSLSGKDSPSTSKLIAKRPTGSHKVV